MASKIYFVGRGPSPLRYNGAVGFTHVIIEGQVGDRRDAWRGTLQVLSVACDMPGPLMIYYPVIWHEVLGPKKKHEVVVGIPRSKCTRNKTIDKEVVGGYLRTGNVR